MSRDDSPLRDRVVFVVGARRSGTNWLGRILSAHPEVVAVPTETYLFSHGIQPLTERFQHANPGAPSIGRTFLQRDVFLDLVRDLVDRVLFETVERHGPEPRYVVERTPWHASHLSLIADVYPDARVLNIIRDGRDIARSLMSMPWGPDSMEEAASEWREAIVDAREGGAIMGERYREVVYETLLDDPHHRIADIFDWLGLDLPKEIWERILLEAGSQFNVDPGSPGVRIEKWRHSVSPTDLRTFERIAGDQLDALGYKRSVGAGSSGALDRARSLVGLESVRTKRRTMVRPRAELGRQSERWLARRLHSDQMAHNELVANFERHVADGDDAAARALLSPKLKVRIDEGAGLFEGRGDEGADALLGALSDHRGRAIHMLSGQTHASSYGLTTVGTYTLRDGSRWARTLVYTVHGHQVREIGLYRHELRH